MQPLPKKQQELLDNILKAGNQDQGLKPLRDIQDKSQYDGAIDSLNGENDLETFREKQQSTGAAFGNIATKFVGKTAVRLLDNIAGTTVGLVAAGNAIINNLGSLSDLDKENNIGVLDKLYGHDKNTKDKMGANTNPIDAFTDNKFSKQVSDPLNEWLDKSFPVYENKDNRESIFPRDLKTLDKVVDGVSYLTSVVLGGEARAGATVAVKTSVKALPYFSRLFKTAADSGKPLEAVAALFEDAADLAKFKQAPTYAKYLEKLNKLGGGTQNLLFGEAAEAGAEARETKQTVTQKLTDQYTQANGGKPLSKEQLQDIDARSSAAGTWNFGINMALLKGTETVAKAVIGKTKWIDDLVNTRNISKVEGAYTQGAKEAAKKSYRDLFKKIDFHNPVIASPVEETGQELGQFASNDFFVNLYTHGNTEEKNTNEYFATSMEAMFPSLANIKYAAKETSSKLGDKDAVESAIIGGLIGFGGGAVGLKSYNKQKQDVQTRTKAYIDYANSINGQTEQAIKDLATLNAKGKASDGAVLSNDQLVYETLKNEQVIDHVQSRMKLGKYEDVVQEFNDLKAIPIDEFNTKYGTKLKEDQRAKLADNLITAADSIKESTDRIMSNYGSKLIEMEDGGKNKDILPYLVKMDLTKKDLIKREGELLTKFRRKGKDYAAFQKEAVNEDFIQARRGDIENLNDEIKKVDADTTLSLEDRNKKKTELVQKIKDANDNLASAVTDKNYKELFANRYMKSLDFMEGNPLVDDKKNNILDVDDVRDIKDFIAIQEAKERIIDAHERIVNDRQWAENIQKQIDFKNKKDAIQQLFTITGNIKAKQVPKQLEVDGKKQYKNGKPVYGEELEDSKRDFELDQSGEDASDYIQENEYYQINSKVWRKRDFSAPEGKVLGKNGQPLKSKTTDIYQPVKVIKTSAEVKNGQIVSNVKFTVAGETHNVSVEEFKKSIKPHSNTSIRIPFQKDIKEFYEQYGDRAIKVRINGKIETGFVKPTYLQKNKNTKVVDSKTVDASPDYINAFAFNFVYANGSESKTVSAKDILDNYVGIEDEVNSLRIKIQQSISRVVNSKRQAKEATQKGNKKAKFWDSLTEDAKKNTEKLTNLKEQLKTLEGLKASLQAITLLNNNIKYYEAKQQILDEAVKYVDSFSDEDLKLGSPALEEAFEKVNKILEAEKEYKLTKEQETAVLNAANKESEDVITNRRLKELKEITKELQLDLIEALDTNANILNNEEYKQAKTISKKLAIASIINPNYVNGLSVLQDKFYDAIKEQNDLKQKSSSDYYEAISKISGLTEDQIRNIKAKEAKLLLNFVNFLTNRGFKYGTEYRPQKVRVANYEDLSENEETDPLSEDDLREIAKNRRETNESQGKRTTTGYDKRTKDNEKPENGEDAFFKELAKNSFEEEPTFRILRINDLEANHKDVFDNLAPGTAENTPNKETHLVLVATDSKGDFRKVDGNFIIATYADSTKEGSVLAKERQEILDKLAVTKDQPIILADVKPETGWFGGTKYSTEIKDFNAKEWGSNDGSNGYTIAIADAEDNKATFGFKLKKGRLYYQPRNSNTYIPLFSTRIGEGAKVYTVAASKEDAQPKELNIVDNFIMGLRYIAQSKDTKDIGQFNTNFLNLLFYTKDGFFDLKFDEEGSPYLDIRRDIKDTNGQTTGTEMYQVPLYIDGKLNEKELKAEIGNRLFNPSYQHLSNGTKDVKMMKYYEVDGQVRVAMQSVTNASGDKGYMAMVENFKFKSYANKNLFRNGNVEIEPHTVYNKEEEIKRQAKRVGITSSVLDKLNRTPVKKEAPNKTEEGREEEVDAETEATDSVKNKLASTPTKKTLPPKKDANGRRASTLGGVESTDEDAEPEIETEPEEEDNEVESEKESTGFKAPIDDPLEGLYDLDLDNKDGKFDLFNVPLVTDKATLEANGFDLDSSTGGYRNKASGVKYYLKNYEYHLDLASVATPFFSPETSNGEINAVMSPEQLKDATAYLARYNVPVGIVAGLINGKRWGAVLKSARALLSDKAPIGTELHEEFHIVSQHILREDELAALYDEQRKIYPKKSNYDLEEILAEQYRMYAQGRRKGFGDLIARAFNKILQVLKGLVRIEQDKNELLKDQLFRNIYAGHYVGQAIHPSTHNFFSTNPNAKIRLDAKREIFTNLSNRAVKNLLARYNQSNGLTRDKSLYSFLNDSGARTKFLTSKNEKGKTPLNEFLDIVFNNKAVVGARFGMKSTTLEAFEAFDLRNEFTELLKKSIGINNNALTDEDLNEDQNAGTKEIVKKGDNEYDHALDAIHQMNLLAMKESNDNFINLPDFIGYVFNNMPMSHNYDNFTNNFKALAIDKRFAGLQKAIVDIINETDNTTDAWAFRNRLFTLFSKQENRFLVLKAFSNGDLKFLDQSQSRTKEEYLAEFKNNLRTNIKDFLNKVKKDRIAGKTTPLFGQGGLLPNSLNLFGLTDDESNKFKKPLYEYLKVFKKSDKLTSRLTTLNSGLSKSINDIVNNNLKQGKPLYFDIEKLFEFKGGNDGDIRDLIDSMITQSETDRLFSLYNAEGNSQYAIANPSSLSKQLEDSPVDSIDAVVIQNGITGETEDGRDLDGKLLTDASEHELHITTIKSVMDRGIVPFIFNGDKSTPFAVQMSAKVEEYVDEPETFWNKFIEEVRDLYDYQSLVGVISLSPDAYDLNIFGFLSNSAPLKYKQLKDNITKDQSQTFKPLDDHKGNLIIGDVTFTRKEVLDARDEYNQSIIDSYDIVEMGKGSIRTDLGKTNYYGTKLDFSETQVWNDYMHKFLNRYQYSISEQQKLTGKLYFYKDPSKRLAAWNSAKININLSESFITDYFNKYGVNFDPEGLRSFVTKAVTAKNLIPQLKGESKEDYQIRLKESPLTKTDFIFGDANDAQGHCIPEFYRFISMASGFWNETIEKAYNTLEALDNKGVINAGILQEANEAYATINEQVSVLKLQNYSLRNVNGIEVPTFYKYSVVPLFRVLTYGKNLDNLRQFMVNNNIHQHMADTANKVGMNANIIETYDSEGNWILPINELSNEDATKYLQISPMKGIGIQVQMPYPHEFAPSGTQKTKLITEDLQGEYTIDGKPVLAKELIAEHDSLVQDKINADTEAFVKKWNLKADFSLKDESAAGKLEFKQKLVREATRRDVSLETVKQLEYYDKYDGLSNKAKIQYLMNSSIRNGIITQKMNGDSKAMMSSVGFESDNLRYSNRLRFYDYKEDGTTNGMEIGVALQDQYRPFVYFDEKTNTYRWKDKVPQKYKEIIGYRIPTQSQASIEKMSIGYFLPPAYKNIVVVPFELTKKAGSDFDIDKLNMFYPKFNEDRAYDEKNVDNKLVEYYSRLLGSPQMRDTVLGTIDNKDIEGLAKERADELVKEKLNPDKSEKEKGWELLNPYYAIRRRISFLQGKYALGATALAATHHAESQKLNIAFNDFNRVGKSTLSELLSELTGKTNWTEQRGRTKVVPLNRIFSKDGHKISDYLSQLINACVDVAKDDYITSINYNLETSSIATMLLRLGVSPQDMIKLISDKNVILYTRERQLEKSLIGDYGRKLNEKLEPSDFEGDTKMLELYLQFEGYTNNLSTLMQVSNFDTKGNGKTIEENEIIKLKIADLETKRSAFINLTGTPQSMRVSKLEQMFFKGDKPMEDGTTGSLVNGFKEVALKANTFNSLAFDSSEWFLNPVKDDLKKGIIGNITGDYATILERIYQQALPDNETKRVKKGLAETARDGAKFKNTFISYLVQQRIIDVMSKTKSKEAVKSDIADILAGLPKQILDAQAKSNNTFLAQLKIVPDATANTIAGVALKIDAITLKDVVRLKEDQINDMTESFEDLYQSNPELAKNIVIFSYFQSGIVNSPISLNNLIPLEITRELLNLTKGSFLNELGTEVTESNGREFVQNMMKRANPLEVGGKANTIYYRHFDQEVIKEVNDIIKKRNLDNCP